MDDFIKRKKDYLQKLKENPRVLQKLTVNEGDPQKMMMMVLDPKNEEELKIVDTLITFFIDILDLVHRAAMKEVKEIPLEENVGISYYIEVINALKDEKEVRTVDKLTPEEGAKILYEFLTGMINDSDETLIYIAEKTGFDLKDEIQAKLLELYLNQANKAFEKNTNFVEETEGSSNKSNLEESFVFCNLFHQICEEGKLTKKPMRTLTDKK